MKVNSYKYILPNSEGIVTGLDRYDYMTPQYIDMVSDYLDNITLTGKVAFLYAGGVVLPASEARNTIVDKGYSQPIKESSIVIRELAAYSMHKWIGRLEGKEKIIHASINGNTCASSMYSLYEAERLFEQGFDEVIIVAEEKTAYNTLRIFDEHNIDIDVGEGLAIIHLVKGEGISDCKWGYEYNRNPFGVTSTGYASVTTKCNYVNPHGTGTDNNEDAEDRAFIGIPQIRYKEKIGHTQGVSGLIEVCMVLEESIKGKVLCVSSGLGGFYGSCIVNK